MTDRSAPHTEESQRLPLSAFVICFNEAERIENCLRSLAMCSEIIVVDNGSTDGTQEIIQSLAAEGLPIQLIHEEWRGYGAQKQFALDHCTQDWLLSIDSDERVSQKLAAILPQLLADTSVEGWAITRYDYINGYGYVPPRAHERYHNRLFRKGKGWFDPTDKVHEGLRIEGRVKKAKPGGLLHFSPIPLHEQMLKENKYSTLKAQMKRERGKAPSPLKMLISPLIFTLRWYFRHGLWRCGWGGFIHAAKGGIYSFLTEAKRWEAEAMERTPPKEPDLTKLTDY